MAAPKFPGDPNPTQVAHADQQMANVRAVADQLVTVPLPATGDRTADVVQLAHGPMVDVMIELATPGMEVPAMVALAAELLYRLLGGDSTGRTPVIPERTS